MSLEKMDDLFGVTELLEQKLADPERASTHGDEDKATTGEHVEQATPEANRDE